MYAVKLLYHWEGEITMALYSTKKAAVKYAQELQGNMDTFADEIVVESIPVGKRLHPRDIITVWSSLAK